MGEYTEAEADRRILKFQEAVRAKRDAQRAYDVAFARHQDEGTLAAWKAKMDALALLTAKATQCNAAESAMVAALAYCA